MSPTCDRIAKRPVTSLARSSATAFISRLSSPRVKPSRRQKLTPYGVCPPQSMPKIMGQNAPRLCSPESGANLETRESCSSTHNPDRSYIRYDKKLEYKEPRRGSLHSLATAPKNPNYEVHAFRRRHALGSNCRRATWIIYHKVFMSTWV